MIIDLTPGFTDTIKAQQRRPIQLMHLHYGRRTCHFSDAPVGIADGLLHDYDPVIEDWGILKDSSNINQSFSGTSLEIRSGTITMIISDAYKEFIHDALRLGMDNSIVELYQWFLDTPNDAPQLIDIMLVQDPIVFAETSSLLQMDVVSVLMKNDPYLWPREEGEETRDIVIGKMTNMPLHPSTVEPITPVSAISQDITFDYTGEVFIANGVGFRPGPDKMTIDSEVIAYDWISASAMNITGRAQDGTTGRPHIRGALICHPDSVFDYTICAGPVALVDNLKGNGEPYTQPVTFFPGQDPVIARFTGRPPWLKVSPGEGGPPIVPDPVESTQYGLLTEYDFGDGGSLPSSSDSINASSGSATLNISNTVGGGPGNFDRFVHDGSAWGVNTTTNPFSATRLYASLNSRWIRTNSTGTYLTDDGVVGSINYEYSADHSSFGDLTGLSVSLTFEICRVYDADIIGEIIFVQASGSEVVLVTEEILEYEEGSVYGVEFSFSGKTVVFDLSSYVSSFAELKDCYIKLQLTNTRTFDYGSSTKYSTIDLAQGTYTVSYFTPAGTVQQPYSELVSHFNRDLSSSGALTDVDVDVRFDISLSNAEVYQAIVHRTTDDPADNSVLWSRTVEASEAAATVNLNLSTASFGDLKNTRIGVYQQVLGPDTEGTSRVAITTFEFVKWNLTYQPGDIETPDEERVVYAEDLVCDVTSVLGENVTPPRAIEYLIDNHSTNGVYIDRAMFETRHLEYVADSYYFNGILKGDIRLHAALKQCLMEGLARFLFAEGRIGLLNYVTYNDLNVDYSVDEKEYFLRSRRQKSQQTSSIVNDSTVMYDYNPATGEFESKQQDLDSESIAVYERHEQRREFTLIRSQPVAELITGYQIARLSRPINVLSFDMFMSGYVLQRGDRILFHTVLKGYKAVGHVESVDRVFGQGKTKRINKFQIAVADAVSTTKFLDLEDAILIDDNDLVTGGATLRLNLVDNVIVDDTTTSKKIHMGLVDQIVIEDINLSLSTNKVLALSDTIELVDSDLFIKKQARLVLSDTIEVSDVALTKSLNLKLKDDIVVDDTDFEASTAKRLKLDDSVLLDDTDFAQKRSIHLQLSETVWVDDSGITIIAFSGYGVGGYGDKEYGN